jgi:hypothetical protein
MSLPLVENRITAMGALIIFDQILFDVKSPPVDKDIAALVTECFFSALAGYIS